MAIFQRRQAGLCLLGIAAVGSAPMRAHGQPSGSGPLAWETDPGAEAIRAGRAALVPDFAEARRAGHGDLAFRAARADLNEDRRPELFVLLEPDQPCGTRGCNLRLYRPEGSRFVLLNTWAADSVTVLHSRTTGWNDLRIGNGRVYRWAGRMYAA